MFQLIVAVISIALVAALAIASIYYGGQAFQKSGVKAAADTLVNGGQQISGAYALYNTDFGTVPAAGPLSASPLEPNYIANDPALPSGASGNWAISATTADVATVSGAPGTGFGPTNTTGTGVCGAVNQLSGASATTFSCDATGFHFAL